MSICILSNNILLNKRSSHIYRFPTIIVTGGVRQCFSISGSDPNFGSRITLSGLPKNLKVLLCFKIYNYQEEIVFKKIR